MKKRNWCNYSKSQTHVRDSCRYKKKRDTIKAAAEEEDSSFVFEINEQPQRTVESKRIMVDMGATSLNRILRDSKILMIHSNLKTILYNWLTVARRMVSL